MCPCSHSEMSKHESLMAGNTGCVVERATPARVLPEDGTQTEAPRIQICVLFREFYIGKIFILLRE